MTDAGKNISGMLAEMKPARKERAGMQQSRINEAKKFHEELKVLRSIRLHK